MELKNRFGSFNVFFRVVVKRGEKPHIFSLDIATSRSCYTWSIVATRYLLLDAGRAYLRSLSIMTAGSLAYTLRSVKENFQEVSDLSERGNMQDYLFAKLPIALIKCGLFRELKSSSVVVYNVLLSYADFNTGTCFPSILTICDFSGLSEPTVVNAIKELEDLGLVEVTRRPGSHNVYQLKYWWGSEPTTPKNLRGALKNFKAIGWFRSIDEDWGV